MPRPAEAEDCYAALLSIFKTLDRSYTYHLLIIFQNSDTETETKSFKHYMIPGRIYHGADAPRLYHDIAMSFWRLVRFGIVK
jgi:hypothetical protein